MSPVELLREINYICLFLLALMIVGLLFTKKKTFFNWMILALYVIMGLVLFTGWNTASDLQLVFPHLALIDLPGVYCVGPVFFYLFLYFDSDRVNLKLAVLFIPAVLATLASLPFYLQSVAEKRTHIYDLFIGGQTETVDVLFSLGLIQSFLYVLLIVFRYRSLISWSILKAEPNMRVIAFILATTILSVASALLCVMTRDFVWFRVSVLIILVSLSGFFIANYRSPGLLKAMIDFSRNTRRYSRSDRSLSRAQHEHLDRLLPELMSEEQLYLNPELSLATLAEYCDVPVHILSQYLNQQMGKNFYQYLNDYRIKAACKMLAESRVAVIEVAYASGFNSKATFNRTFKLLTGQTPLKYREKAVYGSDTA